MSQKYQDYVKINKNILLAFVASFVMSAISAQLLAGQAAYLNTTYTLIVDYSVFFTTFSGLFYWDNRKKYRLDDGTIDKERLRHDLLKIITSLGIAEVAYTIVRWIAQYYFLTIEYDPYMASIISQGISTIAYMIIINMSLKMTRVYKNDH